MIRVSIFALAAIVSGFVSQAVNAQCCYQRCQPCYRPVYVQPCCVQYHHCHVQQVYSHYSHCQPGIAYQPVQNQSIVLYQADREYTSTLPSQWYCYVRFIGPEDENTGAYEVEICGLGLQVMMSGPLNLPLGDCANPSPPGCFQDDQLESISVPGLKKIFRHPSLSDDAWNRTKQRALSDNPPIHYREQ